MAMTISDEAYRALEEAVGEENACREPAMLDSYCWQPFLNMSTDLWVQRPITVVLPGSAEEVQGVVRACNEHGLKFKALSTGWGAQNGPTYDNVVQIDLRRMNRIIDIDEKNMIAVVEPYVCGGELQAEVWKHGLNTHIVGAGPHCSPLAGATSMHGCGNDSIYMSTSSRNLLGVEWVLPNGELLRLGTPGSDAGWFCGDGPGPSLRGIVRGTSGAFGGFGVFTKAALKLFNWPGPEEIDSEGLILDSTGGFPDCSLFYNCQFSKEEDFIEAAYRIGEAEIGYMFVRMVTSEFVLLLMPHLFKKLVKRRTIMDLLDKTMAYPFMILLVGSSKRELAYQEEMLNQIVRDCGGMAMKLNNIPPAADMMGMNLLRCTIFGTVFRSGNMFATNLDGNEALTTQTDWCSTMEKAKKRYIQSGGLLDDGSDNPYMITYENNLFGHCETIYLYDQRNLEHLESLEPLGFDTTLAAIEQCNVPLAAFEPVTRAAMSPLAGNFNRWQKEISRAFDPNGVSDTGLYTDEKEPDPKKIPAENIEHFEWLKARFGRKG
ncbi:MAG TPA: FAD-binding oxidoreductase [Candidatus Anoxymicrobiaceae bacterium]